MHRFRDGRLAVNYASRSLEPRWRTVTVDGVPYDRKALAQWILTRGETSPVSRRPLGKNVADAASDPNPFGILGRAPTYPADGPFAPPVTPPRN